MSYTNNNKATQTQYSVSSDTIGTLLNNYNFGGIRGLALATLLGAQFAMLLDNYNIAQSYYDTNKQDFDFFVSNYQDHMAGLPNSALQEAMGRPFYTPDYLSNVGRSQAKAQVMMDRQWFQARRRANKYQVGVGRRVDYKFAIAKYNAELEGWNLGFRYEDTRKQQYDEQRHAHQTEILNLGISAGNSARQGLATSVGTLSEARSQLSSNLASLGNGYFENKARDMTREGISQIKPNQLAQASSGLYGGNLGGISQQPMIGMPVSQPLNQG